MKNKIPVTLGLIILTLLFLLNLYYAINDYGLKTNTLTQDVLDQVNLADTVTSKMLK